ncbi:MAG TPA: tetratricopeptide repeat protein [Candidatus Dormibacteraeota bacterium]|nr:tetratricopeptide repeat protein [Candidatus Dormibacteraeota bacterium]
MSGFFTVFLVGGLLAGVGYAAWVLSRDAAVKPTKVETPYQQGLNALLAGDREEALQAFAESVRLDSDNVDAFIHLANLLREQGEVQRALQLHRELTVRAGQTPSQNRAIREGLVLDLIAVGRAGEAVEVAEELYDLDRKSGSALKLLLKAHEAAHDWDQAYEVRAEIAKSSGERNGEGLARYRSAIGEIYLRDGKLEDAKRQFKAALHLRRDDPAALLRLGDIYYESNRPERAGVLWKALAEAHPSFSHLVLERLEASYFEKGRFGDVDQAYEEMLARNPKDVRIHLALARMHVKKGDLADAGRVLNEALELEPDSVPARLLLADLYRRRGDLSGALDEMESLMRGVGTGEVYVCAACGHNAEEYWSRCPHCFSWARHG